MSYLRCAASRSGDHEKSATASRERRPAVLIRFFSLVVVLSLPAASGVPDEPRARNRRPGTPLTSSPSRWPWLIVGPASP